MANVNDLRGFLKADMVKTGDLIHFCDAGIIQQKEFKDKDTGKSTAKTVLEMDVMVNDTMKKITYSPNRTSVDLLAAVWGPETSAWVGRTGQVTIVEQISFGKLIPVLVVKPLTHLNTPNAAAQTHQAEAADPGYLEYLREKQAKKAAGSGGNEDKPKPPFKAPNPGGVTDPKDIAWEE